MVASLDSTRPTRTSALAFLAVWLSGILFSVVSFALAIRGRLWDLGFPMWMIWLTVLVGLWQWLWIGPTLLLVRRRAHLYKGFLGGGIWFSFVQLLIWAVLYFQFRHLSLQ
jgi:hypothetical protein